MSSAPRVPLLLLDEPFSGLDSLNARLLLHALVSMVNGNGDDAADAEVGKATSIGSGQAGVGACVLLSIHQPTERSARSNRFRDAGGRAAPYLDGA
jgi:hypothetical protein